MIKQSNPPTHDEYLNNLENIVNSVEKDSNHDRPIRIVKDESPPEIYKDIKKRKNQPPSSYITKHNS